MRFSVIFLILLVQASLGRAGDVWVEAGKPPYPIASIYFEGRIEPGDAEKIINILKQHIVKEFTIWSPGGDVEEAIKLSDILRSRGVRIRTASVRILAREYCSANPSDPSCAEELVCGSERNRPRNQGSCICASACALIWLTAFDNYEFEDYRAIIGVHQPKLAEQYFAQLPFDRARYFYDTMIVGVRDYLRANGVSEIIVSRFLNTPHSSLYFLNDQEVQMSHRSGAVRALMRERCPDSKTIEKLLAAEKFHVLGDYFKSPEFKAENEAQQSCVGANMYEAFLALQR